jgi:hypothetical protein
LRSNSSLTTERFFADATTVDRIIYNEGDSDCAQHQETSMASTTIRVSSETHANARRLAEERQTSISEVVADAISQLKRAAMLEAYAAAAARMRADPMAAADFDAEVRALEGTLADGLDEYPYEGIEELMARDDNL